MERSNSAVLRAIKNHNKKRPISFHVPGHKSGFILGEDLPRELADVFSIDLTELSGLDDLHSPVECILEAEVALAKAYKSKASFFLVNGSTVGNLSMIFACLKSGTQVLVQRNCHKSIMNGLRLVDATPIFLSQKVELKLGIPKGVTLESVQSAIKRFPNAKAIILTYPSYYGTVFDLETIIRFAHDHNIIVLIDEAHGAHLVAGEPFPKSALSLGADIVVQSAHKTLPAMTMSSFLHINSDRINVGRVKEYLTMLQSSSPSYPLILSLDLARQFIENFTSDDVAYTVNEAKRFKTGLEQITGLRVLQTDDPIKLVVQSSKGLSGFALQSAFESVGVFTEFADTLNVLFILPLLKVGTSYPFVETIERISTLSQYFQIPVQSKSSIELMSELPLSTLVYPLSYLELMRSEFVEFEAALDQVSSEQITPYPPGIPLIHRGEQITKGVIRQLAQLINCNAKIQGGKKLELGKIGVFVEE